MIGGVIFAGINSYGFMAITFSVIGYAILTNLRGT